MTDLGELVDLDALAAWMDDHHLEAGPLLDVEPIAGGTQNVLLRFTRGGRSFVFRRPPPHKRKNSDEAMRREARVLAALAGTDVPHPALIAACDETETLGATFYLMEPVDGFNATLELPEPHASDWGMQRAMGFGMADGLLALAAGKAPGERLWGDVDRHWLLRAVMRLCREAGVPVVTPLRTRRVSRPGHSRRRRRRAVARRPPPGPCADGFDARRLPLRQCLDPT